MPTNPGTTDLAYWAEHNASTGLLEDQHGSVAFTESGVDAAAGPGSTNAGDYESGDSDYQETPDGTEVGTGDIDFTIVIWFRIESDANQMLVAKDTNSDINRRDYTLDLRAGNPDLRFYIDGGSAAGNPNIVYSSVHPSLATWYMVTAIHDAANDDLYIAVNDGAADTQVTDKAAYRSVAPLQIGAREYTTARGFFDGKIGTVAMWKRVLTSDEWAWLYNSGSGRLYTDLGSGAAAEDPMPYVGGGYYPVEG